MSNKPPGLNGHSLITFDRSIYLFGGLSDQGYSNSLYEFDIVAAQRLWQRVKTTGAVPACRESHSAVAVGSKLVVCGGRGADTFRDVYILDTISCKWTRANMTGPAPTRLLGSCACVVNSNEVYVIGAHDDDRTHVQVFMFDLERLRWTRVGVSGIAPAARCWQSCTVRGRTIFMFGGYTTGVTNDFWALDTERRQWSLVDIPDLYRPSPRESHAMTLLGDTMYVFGGYNGQQRFDKLIPVDMATREDRLARSVQQLEAELRHAQQRQKTAEAEKETLGVAIAQLTGQMTKLRASKAALREVEAEHECLSLTSVQKLVAETNSRTKLEQQMAEVRVQSRNEVESRETRVHSLQMQLRTESNARLALEKKERVWTAEHEKLMTQLETSETARKSCVEKLVIAEQRVTQLQQELDKAVETASGVNVLADERETARQSLQAQLSLMQQQCEEQRQEMGSMMARLEAALKQNCNTQKELDECKLRLCLTEEEKRQLSVQLENSLLDSTSQQQKLNTECDDLRQCVETLTKERTEWQTRASALEQDVAKLRATVATLEEQAHEHTDTMEQLQEKLRVAQVEVDKAYTVRSDAETQVRNATAKAYEEKALRRTLSHQHMQQRDKTAELTKEVTMLKKNCADLEKTRAKLEGQLRVANQKCAKLLKEQTDSSMELMQVKGELAHLLTTKNDILASVNALARDAEKERALRLEADKENQRTKKEMHHQREQWAKERILWEQRISQEEGMRVSAESRAVTEQEELLALRQQLTTERTQHERALADLQACLQSEQEVRAMLEHTLQQRETTAHASNAEFRRRLSSSFDKAQAS